MEEVDSWGGRSVGVAIEFLMGGSGGRPRCVCERKNAMRSGAQRKEEVELRVESSLFDYFPKVKKLKVGKHQIVQSWES